MVVSTGKPPASHNSVSEFSPVLRAQVSCGTAVLRCHTAETTSHSNHHTHKHSFIVVKDGIRI
ncbi:MAG TPA: hypothetical protein O0X80_06225, partial [Methanocorpusculum sp.]|nr:hypothetical protein [Methanocorpusculum sp.]